MNDPTNLPVTSESSAEQLPTIWEALSVWLGVQIPVPKLPQVARNLDKAIGALVLAVGENLQARIKGDTDRTIAREAFKLEDLVRTEEEKRKLKNRTAAATAAIEDLKNNPGNQDAQSEIDDDWLNLFVRLSEDKSSKELQDLFGRILAGEVRRPGSFSLRTVQLISVISQKEAKLISDLLAYAIEDAVIPFVEGDQGKPRSDDRLFLEGLGLGGHSSQIGGMTWKQSINPRAGTLLRGSHRGVAIYNSSDEVIQISIGGQPLTTPAQELAKIANSPPTELEFLKNLAKEIKNQHRDKVKQGQISLHVVNFTMADDVKAKIDVIWTVQDEDAAH